MSFELHLTEAQTVALQARAKQEGRTVEELVSAAIRDYIARHDGQRLQKAITRIRAEDVELLNRLSD